MKRLYRYDIDYKNVDGDTRLVLRNYPVIRETDYTYFIKPFGYKKEKRVRKKAVTTYAYDTVEKAKKHFIRRTKTRIAWYKYWLEECEKGLKLMESNEIANY